MASVNVSGNVNKIMGILVVLLVLGSVLTLFFTSINLTALAATAGVPTFLVTLLPLLIALVVVGILLSFMSF